MDNYKFGDDKEIIKDRMKLMVDKKNRGVL